MNQRIVWPTQRENQCVKAMKGNWRTIIIQPSFSSFCQSCFCRRYSFQRFSTHFSEIDVCIHQLFVKVNLPQFSKSTASWNLRFCDFHWISKLPMLRAAHCCPISQIEQTNNTLCQQRNNERVPQPWQPSSRGTISTWSRSSGRTLPTFMGTTFNSSDHPDIQYADSAEDASPPAVQGRFKTWGFFVCFCCC
jgi:hypothetical protein